MIEPTLQMALRRKGVTMKEFGDTLRDKYGMKIDQSTVLCYGRVSYLSCSEMSNRIILIAAKEYGLKKVSAGWE